MTDGSDDQVETVNTKIMNQLEEMDGLFGGFFEWLEGQYDPQSGGFFYARSSKESGAFTPDIESTAQALNILERCNLLGAMDAAMKAKVVRFFQQKQDPESGYFYEPDPNMKDDDVMVGRAISYSVGALHKFGAQPLYPLPNGMNTAPDYIQSPAAYAEWLESIPLTNSWRGCDRLCNSAPYLAQMSSEQREPYMREALSYFDRIQDPETGLWGDGSMYVRISGTFKLHTFYQRFGVPMPRVREMYRSILYCLRNETAKDMCYVRNPINLLSSMKIDIPAEELLEIIEITVRNMVLLKRKDGGFSRELEHSPIATNVAQVKAGEYYPDMPKPVPLGLGKVEGDMNAGTQAILIRTLCRELAGVEVPPLPSDPKLLACYQTALQAPIDWAKDACNALIAKFRPEQLPPENRWHYHQGIFLYSMLRVWELTGEESYFEYPKAYVDKLVDAYGNFYFARDELDAIMPGLLLFALDERCGDERYRTAAAKLRQLFHTLNRTSEGGFWHKDKYPYQMWLDGLYMGGVFAVKYAAKYGEQELADMALYQEQLMRKHMLDNGTGLLYHAWDESRRFPWADPETGCSPEFWGRSLGWYGMALVDFLEELPETHPGRPEISEALQRFVKALIRYQDQESGIWYQVVDKGDRPDNWLETSCSSLFVYTIAKAIRLGCLEEEFEQAAKAGYDGLLRQVRYDEDGRLVVPGICIGTSAGDYQNYVTRPVSENDLHGVGAFVLACVEMEKLSVRGQSHVAS